MTLSKEQIEAIKARAEKATPGPWTAWDHAGWYQPYVSVVDTDKKDIIAPGVPGDETAIGRTWGTRGKYEIETDNAEFIAHARDDIPYLLSHITAIEADRDRMREALENLIKAGATEIIREGRGFTAQYVKAETVARAALSPNPRSDDGGGK